MGVTMTRVRSVRGGAVYAQCLTSHGPRTFRSEQILAVMPVVPKAG